MAFTHSKNSVFKVQDSGGTLQVVSGFCNKGALKQSADTAETTTFGNNAKSYIGGLTDATSSIEGSWDGAASAIDSILSGILGATKNFEYHPAGTTTGTPKKTGSVILKSYEITSDVGNEVKFTAEFQHTGGITNGTN